MICPPCLECNDLGPEEPNTVGYEKQWGLGIIQDHNWMMPKLFLRGAVHVYMNGEEITKDCADLDPLKGWVVLYHRNDEGNRHMAGYEPGHFCDNKCEHTCDHVCKVMVRGKIDVYIPGRKPKVDA